MSLDLLFPAAEDLMALREKDKAGILERIEIENQNILTRAALLVVRHAVVCLPDHRRDELRQATSLWPRGSSHYSQMAGRGLLSALKGPRGQKDNVGPRDPQKRHYGTFLSRHGRAFLTSG